MLAPIYICPEHGETWHAERADEIDTQNDDVYTFMVCPKCYREVRPLLQDGHQVFHAMTDEEIFWEMQAAEGEQI